MSPYCQPVASSCCPAQPQVDVDQGKVSGRVYGKTVEPTTDATITIRNAPRYPGLVYFPGQGELRTCRSITQSVKQAVSSGIQAGGRALVNGGVALGKWAVEEAQKSPYLSPLEKTVVVFVGTMLSLVRGQHCATDQFRCSSGQCIHTELKCDMYHDCKDGSDEQGCDYTCAPRQLRCLSGGCIPKTWRCDAVSDCKEGSDEQECGSVTCAPDEFRCPSGQCIHATMQCDGDVDCRDGSGADEQECCTSDQLFRCPSSGECIPAAWRCDTDEDCDDGSDEQGCEFVICTPNQFRCQSGQCIPAVRRCDPYKDCGDGSDVLQGGCAAGITTTTTVSDTSSTEETASSAWVDDEKGGAGITTTTATTVSYTSSTEETASSAWVAPIILGVVVLAGFVRMGYVAFRNSKKLRQHNPRWTTCMLCCNTLSTTVRNTYYYRQAAWQPVSTSGPQEIPMA